MPTNGNHKLSFIKQRLGIVENWISHIVKQNILKTHHFNVKLKNFVSSLSEVLRTSNIERTEDFGLFKAN